MTTIVYTGNSSINPPFPVTRSVRTRAAATGYFSRTFGTPTNASRWTKSLWIKRARLGYVPILGAQTINANANYAAQFNAGDTFTWQFSNTLTLVTTQVFRDPSAWYHIVLVWDCTNATAANRAIIYVNGVQVTAFTTDNRASVSATQNAWATAGTGFLSYNNGTNTFDGYITEVNFIDGQALTPSAFGAFNGTTGVWEPRKYGGTYGANGFYLNFQDNSGATATTIGKDSSGNGNNWTPTNISVTAGTTYDSMIDVPGLPTNSASNYPTLNNIASANFSGTYSNANLNFISGVAGQWRGAVATQFLTSGKFYFEATIQVLGAFNYTMIGACGLQTSISLFSNYTGFVANGWSVQSGTGSGGTRYNGGSGVNIANAAFTQFALNDVLQCAVDVTNGRIWFGKNNVWLEGDPAAGTGASYTNLTGPIAPSISCFDTTAQLAANFGQRPFTYTPPTGFKSVNSYNLGMPSIPNGATQFAATTYTGNGSTQSITNNVLNASFQPDLVWIKGRSGATNNGLQDSVRGTAGGILVSNSTAVESAGGAYISSLNSNGFTVNANTSGNGSAATYVGWNWKASNVAAVTNTSGSITSQVSANPAAGFSIVTYTGTGANATVGHGLGVAPRMIIIKGRSTVSNWPVYHIGQNATPQNGQIFLDVINAYAVAATIWNNTAPTSSVFSLGTNTNANTVSQTYVAYCFAGIEGYSSFGSYTGNGVADGIFVYTGFRPRYVCVKRVDAVGGWTILDTSRSPFNVEVNRLNPNGSNAETTGFNVLDGLSNGFKIRDADPTWNASGGTYIYMAFAENPFQYALAR